jgi:hypothetical protein
VSDFDLDALLAGAVDDYHRQTLPQIMPAGTAQARATATHRKRVRTAIMSAVALIVIAVPAGVYAATDHNPNGPPAGVTSSQSPSPQPSESPSASPSASPSTVPSSAPPTSAPITQQELSNATLNLPAWGGSPCPSGVVKLHNGQLSNSPATGSSFLVKSVSVDLDRDGSADAVGLFECHVGDPPIFMAVGFRRAPDGSIKTLGKVVTDIDELADVRAGDAGTGTVQLQVSDLAGSDGVATTGQVKQWRTYEWVGTRFNQTAGSTSFSASVPALAVTLSDLTFQPPVNGKRTGTMTVTLHNAGTTTIDNASVVYELTIAPVTAPKCDRLQADFPFSGQCAVQPIAPGATVAVTFTLSGDAASFGTPGTSDLQAAGEDLIQIRVGDQKLTTQPALGKLIVK